MQAFCQRIVAAVWFEKAIIGLILINALVLGLETSPELVQRFGGLMLGINRFVLIVFVIEAMMKITAIAPRWRLYFGDGWNLFDFTVVVLSLLPATGQYAMIARLARLLRVMRLVSTMPELRLIVSTLIRSLPGLGNVILLLLVIFYIYAVAGYHLLHEHDPTHWRSLGISLLTLFRILTLEDWTDVMYTAMQMNSMMWLYFVSFVVVATFVVINLFIAVVINNLDAVRRDSERQEAIASSDAVRQIHEMRINLERLEYVLVEQNEQMLSQQAGNKRKRK